MATPQSEREEYLTHLRHRIDELQSEFEDIMRAGTRDNDMETLARVERAKKSVAGKGERLEALLDEVSGLPDDRWEEGRDRLDAAWKEYREAVERLELEFERVEELG